MSDSTTETAKPSNQELRSQMVEKFDPDGSRRARVERDHGGLPAMPESCDHCLTVLERDALVARVEALLAERDAAFDAAGLPRSASVDDLIRHHRSNAAIAQEFLRIAADAWQERAETAEGRVAVLEAALREIAATNSSGYGSVNSSRLGSVLSLARAVLAGGDAAAEE